MLYQDWILVSFFIGLAFPLMIYLIRSIFTIELTSLYLRKKVAYSWYGRLGKKHSKQSMITILVISAVIGIIFTFLSYAGNIPSGDPVRIQLGIASFAGALLGGFTLMLIPRKHAITSEGIVSGVTSDLIRWPDIITYRLIKESKVLVIERALFGFRGMEYIPLGDNLDAVEKALAEAHR